MKITVLLRYPRIESNQWKRMLIENLIREGYEISVVFGEKSYYRHFKAALREYGTSFLKKKKTISSTPGKKNLYKFFKEVIPVYRVNDLNSDHSKKIIQSINPDYILLLGTGIIRQHIFSIPAKGTVHCHHGYLPDFRGVSTAEWSMYLDKDVYITTHYVDKGVDTGDIISERKVDLFPGDTIDAVRLRCRDYSVELIEDTFRMLKSGNAKIRRQTREEGKQYFFMHPFFKNLVNKKLKESI